MAEEREQPTPPGGPLRDDRPSGPLAPGGTPEGAEPAGEDGPADGEDGSIPQPTGTEREQGDAARDLQEENAETSLDQPSS